MALHRFRAIPRWRHQMEAFSALLALCAGNSTVTGEFPSQRPVTQSFDIFFDLRLNKPLSKQSRGWWFETPCRSLWRHCNGRVGIEPLSEPIRPMQFQDSWGSCYYHGLTSIRTWICNYFNGFLWDVITHPCPNLNEGLTRPITVEGRGQVITFHLFTWMWSLIHALIPMLA